MRTGRLECVSGGGSQQNGLCGTILCWKRIRGVEGELVCVDVD